MGFDMLFRKRMISGIAAAAVLAVPLAGRASDLQYHHYEAVAGDKVRSVRWADFDGDGRLDLVTMRTRILEKDRKVEKHFDLFLQTSEGFSKAPDQSFRASDHAVVYDVGDFDPATAGPDIGYVSPEGVFSYSFADGRFAIEPRRIISVKSVFTAPDATSILSRELLRDYDGDGVAELMIPDADQWYFFKLMKSDAPDGLAAGQAASGREWRIRQILPVPLDTELSNIWEGNLLFARMEYGTTRITQMLPEEFLADYDGDGRKDLIIGRSDRLQVFKASENGNFSEVPEQWDFGRYGIQETMRHGHLAPLTRITVADINGDGKADVVLSKVTINDLSKIELLSEFSVFINRGGSFAASPDQIFHIPNLTEKPYLVDINGDGALDLVYQEIPFGVWQGIRIWLFGSISIKYRVHYSKNGIFSDDADQTRAIPFEFDLSHQGSGIITAFRVDEDFNGDGLPDLMQSAGPEEFEICLSTGKKWAKNCSSVEVPQTSFFAFPVDLNGDKRADLVIRYGGEGAHDGSLRILMSR